MFCKTPHFQAKEEVAWNHADSFRKKPFDSTLGYLNCFTPYKISYHTFTCSSHSWLQLLLLMPLPGLVIGDTGLSHHLGEWEPTFRNTSHTFCRKQIVSTWGGNIWSICFYWCSPRDHPEVLFVPQVSQTPCMSSRWSKARLGKGDWNNRNVFSCEIKSRTAWHATLCVELSQKQ